MPRVCDTFHSMIAKTSDDTTGYDKIHVVFEGERMRLKQEIKARRISETGFAELSEVSHTWLRRILGGEHAGDVAKKKIRAALEICTVCGHKMEVPPDDVLYAVATRKKRRA